MYFETHNRQVFCELHVRFITFEIERIEMFTDYENIPRIYTAIAEWSACFTFALVLPRKVSNVKFGIISALFLILQSLLLVFTDHVSLVMWFPVMVLAVVIMCGYMVLVCEVISDSSIYFGLKAFVVAEFIASLEWQLAYYFSNVINMNVVLHLSLLVIVYVGSLVVIYGLEKKEVTSDFVYEISRKELISILLIVLATFTFSNLSFLPQKTPFSGEGIDNIFNIRTLVNLGGIAILYAYQSRVFELQTEKELMAINTAFQAQYDHYRNYSESIELINVKYHDLKHQIAGLRGEMSAESRKDWIENMEAELETYKPEKQTGNYILDTLIAGKMNSCSKQKIKFTCVVDGCLLNFIHVIDICNIFGNALDNAIENVSLVEDEEKRLIHMSVFAKGSLLFISVQNYCENNIQLKNGYPVTTKADKANHGYGMKSIDYTVKKYGGNLSFGVEKDMFELKILIPMKTD